MQIFAWVVAFVEGSSNVRPRMSLSMYSAHGKTKLRDLTVGDKHYFGEVSRIGKGSLE